MKANLKFLFAISCALLVWVASCSKKKDPTPVVTPPVSTTKSAAKAITKFSFVALSPAVDATVDATAKTISATVPAGTDATKLVPTITPLTPICNRVSDHLAFVTRSMHKNIRGYTPRNTCTYYKREEMTFQWKNQKSNNKSVPES